ncbi:MAG: heme lyase CcmF/NrfE family subunit [Burkholderiales bacterium]|nr:heme lyase CcmF/NrfE family subunit [Burkholderiales bacterium]
MIAAAVPEAGHFFLWLALGVAVLLAVLPIAGSLPIASPFGGARILRPRWVATARPLTYLLGALIALAYASLTAAFVRNDFSVLYVALHSNLELPLPYRVAGVWGGHEGSLLLWLALQSVWMAAVARFSRGLPAEVVGRVLGVMGAVAVGFLLFTLTTSNPFERLFPVPPNGRDLNPLLQDPGMVIHPPMLYTGYVGFSVAFALAVAGLIGGRLDATWARWTRPWTVTAWACLTVGIALGSWWAYYELGWGGWWFWDPVENASFMPWLVGTALIHSLAVTEKRGAFKSWTVLLAIIAFSLSLLGTFLVRSGVLSSVHAFATDPARGLFILGFLVTVVGSSLTLYAWRAPSVGLGARFHWSSRETTLLANNVMFVAACGAVLLGTLYPLALDALGLGKISVGPPYFETVFVPLMAPVIFLMGVGPLARWKQAELPELAKRLRWALVVALLATGAQAFMHRGNDGGISWMAMLGLLMAWWVVASLAADAWERLAPRRPGLVGSSWLATLKAVPRSFVLRAPLVPRSVLAMWVAHLGIAVFIFGVTMVRTFEVERDVKMGVGDHVTIADLTFTLRGLREREGPNYRAVQGWVEVTRGEGEGKVKVVDLLPEKRVYRVQDNPMTEAAIATRLTQDLYVSLGEPVEDGAAWIVRVYIKPFVDWIWGGCVLMALGGLLAAGDRRYRVRAAAQVRTGEARPGLA